MSTVNVTLASSMTGNRGIPAISSPTMGFDGASFDVDVYRLREPSEARKASAAHRPALSNADATPR